MSCSRSPSRGPGRQASARSVRGMRQRVSLARALAAATSVAEIAGILLMDERSRRWTPSPGVLPATLRVWRRRDHDLFVTPTSAGDPAGSAGRAAVVGPGTVVASGGSAAGAFELHDESPAGCAGHHQHAAEPHHRYTGTSPTAGRPPPSWTTPPPPWRAGALDTPTLATRRGCVGPPSVSRLRVALSWWVAAVVGLAVSASSSCPSGERARRVRHDRVRPPVWSIPLWTHHRAFMGSQWRWPRDPLGLLFAKVPLVRSAIGRCFGLRVAVVAWCRRPCCGRPTARRSTSRARGSIPSIANGRLFRYDQTRDPAASGSGPRRPGLTSARTPLPAALPGYLAGCKQGWAFSWRSDAAESSPRGLCSLSGWPFLSGHRLQHHARGDRRDFLSSSSHRHRAVVFRPIARGSACTRAGPRA